MTPILRLYCVCGGAVQASGSLIEDVRKAWQGVHTGEGHAETTASIAGRNRRKAERLVSG